MSVLKRGRGLRKQDSLDLDAVLKEYESEASDIISPREHLNDIVETDELEESGITEWSEPVADVRKKTTVKNNKPKIPEHVARNILKTKKALNDTETAEENGSLADCIDTNRKHQKSTRHKQKGGLEDSMDSTKDNAKTARSKKRLKGNESTDEKGSDMTESDTGVSEQGKGRRAETKKKRVKINSQQLEFENDVSEATTVSETSGKKPLKTKAEGKSNKLALKREILKMEETQNDTDIISDDSENEDEDGDSNTVQGNGDNEEGPIPLCVNLLCYN